MGKHVNALLLVLGVAVQAVAEPPPPRVIWVAIDSLRADHLHFAGYPRETSPWMDEQASSGAVFTMAFAPASSTPFSVGATFAGRYYSLMDHASHPPHIRSDVTTLSEALSKGGVSTYAWIGNVPLASGRRNGYDRGFQQWETILPRRAPTPSIDEITRVIEDTYEQSRGAEFHYIHTMDVHHPYVPPIPFDRLWPEHAPTPHIRYGEAVDRDGNLILSNFPFHSQNHDINDDDISFLISQYDGAIRYTDARLPALLDALSYDPDNDFLIVSSDHGEQFFEHGFWGHGRSVFPVETKVPLLILGPGIVGTTHDEPVSLIDLFPTLCDLFRVKHPPELDGISLMPALLSGSSEMPERIVYTENPLWTGGVFAPEAAIIHGTDFYRILANLHWRKPWRIWPVDEGLYDLSMDPLLTKNDVADRKQRANELNALLRAENPRFEPYKTTAIRKLDEDVAFGPDLIPTFSNSKTKTQGYRSRTPLVRRRAGESIALTVRDSDFEIEMPTHAGRPHQFSFEYQSTTGAFRLSLQNAATREPFFEYSFLKPQTDSTELRAMVTPTANRSVLVLSALRPGDAGIRVKSMTLRVAEIPAFEVVQWINAPSGDTDQTDSSTEFNDALKALGYLE